MSANRRNISSEDLGKEVLAKIKQYAESGFKEAERIHQVIMQANPDLHPRLWYGMPGYAKTKDSAVLCFFRKDELITFGFTEAVNIAALSDGSNNAMLPSAWYVTELTEETEKTISNLVKRATILNGQ